MSVNNFTANGFFQSNLSMDAITFNESYLLPYNNSNISHYSDIYTKSLIKTSSDITTAIVSTTIGTFIAEPQSMLYKYLKLLAEVMTVYFTPVLTIAGTIGNVLSVMVFFCTKLKKLSSSYYLAFLAFFDTGFLWCNFIQWLSFLQVNLYKRDGFCQLFTWLSNACSVLSVWLVVAFTIERFVAVMYPLKRPILCTVRRARCIVFYLVLFNAINSSPLLLFATSKNFSKSMGNLECVVDQSYEVSKIIF